MPFVQRTVGLKYKSIKYLIKYVGLEEFCTWADNLEKDNFETNYLA